MWKVAKDEHSLFLEVFSAKSAIVSRVHSREGNELKVLEFHCVVSAKPPVAFEQWVQMENAGEILLRCRKAYGKTWRLTIVMSVCAYEQVDKDEVVNVCLVLIIYISHDNCTTFQKVRK